MKLVRVSQDIDWRSVKSDLPDHIISEWFIPGYDLNVLETKVDLDNCDFRINVTGILPYIYENNSKWAKHQRDWSKVDKMLMNWHYQGTILVTETVYGKNSGVLADYQGDGTFLSEDGDRWKLTELVSWES